MEFEQNQVETCTVIDVMLVMRTISWKNLSTFGDVANEFCKIVKNKATSQNTTRLDFIFDSYFEKSIKSSERLRRRKSECIIYNNITVTSPLPKQTDTFWGSSDNKILLQTFLRRYIENNNRIFSGLEFVFSTINEIPCASCNLQESQLCLQNLQRNDIEEADIKIILHVQHAVLQGFKNVYIISSDTDVIVLLLYFWSTFKQHGLQVY